MFNVKQPPLLVMPVSSGQLSLLPEGDGYRHHAVSGDEIYSCYKTGWTFPLSVEQRGSFTEKPLLLVRDKGRVTAEGSAFLKGYAHRFVTDDGHSPDIAPNGRIFPNDKHSNWLLVPDHINVVWLQYGYRGQATVGPVSFQEQMDYGKLMILKLEIIRDTAPLLDKRADLPDMHDIHYRVEDRQLLYHDWSVTNQNPMTYLGKLLSDNKLDVFRDAVAKSLEIAGCKNLA